MARTPKEPRAPKRSAFSPVIPCVLEHETKLRINKYAEDLRAAAHTIGAHGLTNEDFVSSGLFRAAIERIRGQQSASMGPKREFLDEVLGHLKRGGFIKDYQFTGAGDRHDYHVILLDDRVSVFEAKGCLDGNNTTIWTRPESADEFVIWSLCQNAGADPAKNAWSGIHTRLGGRIVAQSERVDGLVIWDMVCGTIGRPCPKLLEPGRLVTLDRGREVPPPCLYLFPRTVPHPRNNPRPHAKNLPEVGLLAALHAAFGGRDDDVRKVEIECRMNGVELERRTILSALDGTEMFGSDWTELKQART